MTTIEWCDETWNPVVGCSRVSAGCDHCYAMGVAHRKMSPQHVGLTKLRPRDASRPGVDWTGEVRTLPERLDEPLRWRKPRRVFVNSMSDLFHPGVPFDFVAAVFGVMAACPQHTFLVLTKRPERALEYLASDGMPDPCGEACKRLDAIGFERGCGSAFDADAWPLPNVHLGVSAEDQATFDERVPLLLQCPAAVRWVSAEPLLGPIDMRQQCYREPGLAESVGEHRRTWPEILGMNSPGYASASWIVVGGESGPGARQCDIQWVRSIVEQCRDAAVPVFVKQLGAKPAGLSFGLPLHDRKGGDPMEWPADLRVREYPEVQP